MSKEKVEKYKKEKAVRRHSLKKEKRQKTVAICICIAALVIGAGFGGYYFGNKDGYGKGYSDGFSIAGQFYKAAASGSAVTSGNTKTASEGAVNNGTGK
ncbi:MAG: hypothetical protein ACTTKP_04180 [Catonella sp.]|uniref:hypothetical protein n=1 Tax=Catonella sp. TaxID=2382125 RepID=UPI003FA1168E